MDTLSQFITWSVDPEIARIGTLAPRWYGLLFASGFIVGYYIMERIYKNEKKPLNDVNTLLFMMVIGTLAGARLGHCLFYNPDYYLSRPLEILKVWEGGLASHGAAIGIFISLYYYSRNRLGQPYLWVLDRIVVPAALAGSFIRLGNLFNSEIIGKPTDVAWAFVFTRVDIIPRHPAQLYESLAYLVIFFILFRFYWRSKGVFKEGFLLGWFLILIFGVRFFIEFLKEIQSPFEAGLSLNMGQWLSIPMVALGVYFLRRRTVSPKRR